MRNKVSLKDIAKASGVSTAVVSFVMNNKYVGRVSEAKAQQVKAIAKELNYTPNQIAKSLKKDRTYTIGLIIADISNLFYSNIARYIEDASKRYQYNVIFGSADENADKFNELVQVMLSRQVDGIILAAPKGTEDTLNYLKQQQIPFVLIDRHFPKLMDINSIGINNYQASHAVVEHIVKEGFKRPAMITLRTELAHMRERAAGFKHALTELLHLDKPQVVEIQEELLAEQIEEVMLGLRDSGVDLVYFATNKIAMEGLAAMVKHGVRVPREMGVICFDEADAYKIFHTSISFVRQPLQQIGQESVEMLVALIDGKQSTKSIVLNTQIIRGNSSLLLK